MFGSVPSKSAEQVTGVKTRRNSMGGWSQARYQRRAENFHLHHVKEVVDTLDRIVRADNIQHVIVAGDDVVVPLLEEQLPQHLTDKLVDVLKLERDAGEDEIVEATLEVLRQKDAETDAERVARAGRCVAGQRAWSGRSRSDAYARCKWDRWTNCSSPARRRTQARCRSCRTMRRPDLSSRKRPRRRLRTNGS